MKEKALSEEFIRKMNEVLDVVEGKKKAEDIVGDTVYHHSKESEAVVKRLQGLAQKDAKKPKK